MERRHIGEGLSDYEEAVEGLIRCGLDVVDARYGSGSTDPKPYHGLEHSLWVLSAAECLGDTAVAAGRISPRHKQLLRIAAAFHDAVHSSTAMDNEELSAETAARFMRVSVFSPSDTRQVIGAIMATRVREVSPTQIYQSAGEGNYMGMLLADADLSAFGAEPGQYWAIAQLYFAETRPGQKLAGQALRDFAQEQRTLVGSHRFYTIEARQLFNHRLENVALLDQLAP